MLNTIKRISVPFLGMLLSAAVMSVPAAVSACSSCYGSGANGPMVDGMNTAILVMIGIVGAVLTCIAFFFIMMLRRAYRLRLRTPQLS